MLLFSGGCLNVLEGASADDSYAPPPPPLITSPSPHFLEHPSSGEAAHRTFTLANLGSLGKLVPWAREWPSCLPPSPPPPPHFPSFAVHETTLDCSSPHLNQSTAMCLRQPKYRSSCAEVIVDIKA